MGRISRLQLVLMVAVVGLLALGVFLAVQYVGALGRGPELEKEIDDVNRQIAAIQTCDIDDLNYQLEECIRKLQEESPFPAGPFDDGGPYDQKEITDALFDVTDDARVYLNSLDNRGDSKMKIGENEYRADQYKLKCSTDENKEERLITLLQLFEDLRLEVYPTLVIDNVKFPGGGLSIDFDLAIITQKLD